MLDNQGNPVHGATVNRFGPSVIHMHVKTRTDDSGKFQIPGLSYEKFPLWVNSGNQYAMETIDFNEKTSEVLIRTKTSSNDKNVIPPPQVKEDD